MQVGTQCMFPTQVAKSNDMCISHKLELGREQGSKLRHPGMRFECTKWHLIHHAKHLNILKILDAGEVLHHLCIETLVNDCPSLFVTLKKFSQSVNTSAT